MCCSRAGKKEFQYAGDGHFDEEIGARMRELRPGAPTTATQPKALKKALDAMRA
ncbi:hypothetical protein [Dactylosporangium sp. NPDC005555]|uniref:hypothetical protein n=1 Tax=Dactylosporangium sp. NPDC005555 TaxID=3154889 RepID=UPI0033A5486E